MQPQTAIPASRRREKATAAARIELAWRILVGCILAGAVAVWATGYINSWRHQPPKKPASRSSH